MRVYVVSVFDGGDDCGWTHNRYTDKAEAEKALNIAIAEYGIDNVDWIL